MTLGRDDALALAAMGPSAFHASAADLAARAAALPETIVVAGAVTVSAYGRLAVSPPST
jgi:23S rRNA (guanine745-N1)-methyltransferase